MYRVYVLSKRTVITSNQVHFAPESTVTQSGPSDFRPEDYEIFNDTGPDSVSDPTPSPVESREAFDARKFNPNEYEIFDNSAFIITREPKSYDAVTHCKDWDLWNQAIQSELEALDRNKTW